MNEEQKTDADLLRVYGDESICDSKRNAAFSAIVERHGNMILGLSYRLVGGDHALAKDVTQGTFIVLAERANSVLDRDSLSAWLCTVARRLAATAVDKEVRRRKREQIAMERQNGDVASRLDAEVTEFLQHCLHGLSPKLRSVILLHYLEGKDYAETALILNCTQAVVRKRVQRAITQLRRENRYADVGIMLAAVAASVITRTVATPEFISACASASAAQATQTLSAASVELTKGVLQAMKLRRITVTTTGILAAAALTVLLCLQPIRAQSAEAKRKADKAIAKSEPVGNNPTVGGYNEVRAPVGLPAPEDGDVEALAKGNAEFCFDLFHELRKRKKGNFLFSPHSLVIAMDMVAGGARGQTAIEIGTVRHYPKSWRSGDPNAPWDMGRIHHAMGFLNSSLAKAVKDDAGTRQKIGVLRRAWRAVLSAGRKHKKAGNRKKYFDTMSEADRIADRLNWELSKIDQYELRLANSLWGDQSFKFTDQYRAAIAKYYGTRNIRSVDFKSNYPRERKVINRWVEAQTEGNIKDLLPQLPSSDATQLKLVLVNAIYFKGEWQVQFKANQTKTRPFFEGNGRSISVSMMSAMGLEGAKYAAFNEDHSSFATPLEIEYGKKERVYPDKGYHMLELPYKGDRISMLVVAPLDTNGLDDLCKDLSADRLATWIRSLRERDVHVNLPKFKFRTRFDLSRTLHGLGMKQAFGQADFSGMAETGQDLRLSQVVQEAVIEVNEKGTEAVAATGFAKPSATIEEPFTPTFNADRPFIFFIRDKHTGSVLFMGRYSNPR